MSQPELTRRTVLTRFWVGDVVYHIADSARGTVLRVEISTERFVPKYFMVFDDREGEWCEEMELRSDKVFIEADKGGNTA